MFGSIYVGRFVSNLLLQEPVITNVVGDRIANIMVMPQGYTLPAILHYMESGSYDGVTYGEITEQDIQYVVRIACEGESTVPILAAAEKIVETLNNSIGSVDGYYINGHAVGEWPITTLIENGIIYRQLGTYFNFHVGVNYG